jgi:phage terminase large subunit
VPITGGMAAARHIRLPNDFDPRWYQLPFMEFFTADGSDGAGKAADWVMHRRGGKDLVGMHTKCMLMHRRIGAYWHTFPTFEQGRKAIWEGFRSDGKRIIDNVFPAEVVRRRDNQQMVIELKCGSIYRVLGTDKIETVGAGPVGVLHSEYSIAKPKAADLIAPMLRENRGWEAYVFTPRGNNHGKQLHDRLQAAAKRDPKRYFSALMTLFDTRAYDPDQTIAEERARGRPEALIRQEYLCDWTAANVGAVWGDLIEAIEKAGAVAEFDFDRARVFTVWDLGGAGAHGDATCFWIFAVTDEGADVLDYYEAHGKPLSHYFDEVDRRCRSIGVRPVRHWLPHDARAKHLTGVSVLEQCAEHWGLENVAIYPEDSLLNGIQAGRWLLQRKVRFHPRCQEGVEALKAYHYAWDEDRKVFSNAPEHDWSSHPADGFRGLSLVARESERRTHVAKPEPKPKYVVPVRPTLDQIFESAPKPSGRI